MTFYCLYKVRLFNCHWFLLSHFLFVIVAHFSSFSWWLHAWGTTAGHPQTGTWVCPRGYNASDFKCHLISVRGLLGVKGYNKYVPQEVVWNKAFMCFPESCGHLFSFQTWPKNNFTLSSLHRVTFFTTCNRQSITWVTGMVLNLNVYY